MRLRGREDELEMLNRKALEIAREVADKHGKLMAGNLSNNPLYDSKSPEIQEQVYRMMEVSKPSQYIPTFSVLFNQLICAYSIVDSRIISVMF